MQPLSPANLHLVARHLNAAQGYLGLGMPMDAWNELEEVPAEFRSAREVLLMRVAVCQAMGKWEMMAEVCRFLAKHEPDEPVHVLDLAFAVRRHESPSAAAAILEAARPRFPTQPLMAYNLACYYAVEGRTEEAKPLLAEAFRLDDSLRVTALDDPDLEGIW